MGAILRILLIAVLFFYAFSMLIKLIFRRKLRKLEKQAKQFTQDDSNATQEAKPHVNPNIGEYTDFEEVE